MATAKTTKKTAAAPKKKGKSTGPITVEMTLAKVTKNTYRFEDDTEGTPVSTLYVAQSAFSAEPKGITVTVSSL